MRFVEDNDTLSVKAYAGTTGILLAFNLPAKKRKGLLGFAIERAEGRSTKFEMLKTSLVFPGQSHKPGELHKSSESPVQKFRWSDYRVYPDKAYRYRVYPVYGSSTAPALDDPVEIAVRSASAKTGEHRVMFNRAAAASQAFSVKFPEVELELKNARKEKREPVIPAEVWKWLARGLEDQITNFIASAVDDKWALDIAIYEYELPLIVDAVNAADDRNVEVRVIYHKKEGDEQTEFNEENLAHLKKSQIYGRVPTNLFHNKFIVLSKIDRAGNRTPVELLTGSTNFTENGVYRQANIVHISKNTDLAESYLDHFEYLWQKNSFADTKKYISENNLFNSTDEIFAGFSPRKSKLDLTEFVNIIGTARRDLLFSTAFKIYAPILEALAGKPHDEILRYGIENSKSTITGYHADRTAEFSARAMLNKGLEGWLKESLAGQRGNILIHTKLVVVDFTSDSPTVLSGSHNLSANASANNDENFLIIRNNPNVADCYGCELMRIYDHYRYRFRVSTSKTKTGPKLKPNDSWTDRYYEKGNLANSDRLRFAGK